jgi:hypothetical protein
LPSPPHTGYPWGGRHWSHIKVQALAQGRASRFFQRHFTQIDHSFLVVLGCWALYKCWNFLQCLALKSSSVHKTFSVVIQLIRSQSSADRSWLPHRVWHILVHTADGL